MVLRPSSSSLSRVYALCKTTQPQALAEKGQAHARRPPSPPPTASLLLLTHLPSDAARADLSHRPRRYFLPLSIAQHAAQADCMLPWAITCACACEASTRDELIVSKALVR